MEKIELTIDELRHIQFAILEDIHSFCSQNGITYYLTYGTLLGAARHQGFIPWDDDIDICMPRPDYERFLQIYSSKEYKLFHALDGTGYAIPFAKVSDMRTTVIENANFAYPIGVAIDVFPIDGLSKDFATAKKHHAKICCWRNLLNIKKIRLSKNRSLKRNAELCALKIVTFFIPYHTVLYRLMYLMTKYDYLQSEYAADLNFGTERRIVHKRLFEGKTELLFEGKRFYVPQFYDELLTNIFGNYMQLPPEEKRKTHHSFKAYWK